MNDWSPIKWYQKIWIIANILSSLNVIFIVNCQDFFYVRCNNLDSSVQMYWRYQSKTLGHSYKRYWVVFSNSSHSSHCDGVKIISHWCHILNTTRKKRSQYYVFVPNLRKTSIVVKLYCVIHHTNFHQTWSKTQHFSQATYKVADKFIH